MPSPSKADGLSPMKKALIAVVAVLALVGIVLIFWQVGAAGGAGAAAIAAAGGATAQYLARAETRKTEADEIYEALPTPTDPKGELATRMDEIAAEVAATPIDELVSDDPEARVTRS